MNTTTAAASTTTGCVILPTDFNKNTADPNRRRWTAGQLRHVVAALAGMPVAIVADNQTGFTLVGVTLLAVTHNSPGHDLLTESTYVAEDGAVTTQRTRYRIFQLGETILPLSRSIDSVKSTAIRLAADEGSAAIKIVCESKYGEAAGRQWGSWKAEPILDGSIVKYTPHTGNEAYADKWGTKITVQVSLDGKIVRVYEGV